jgi:hypothetical protein
MMTAVTSVRGTTRYRIQIERLAAGPAYAAVTETEGKATHPRRRG